MLLLPIHEKLRKLMAERKGMTPKALAFQTTIPYATLKKVLSGERPPHSEDLHAIANKGFGISYKQLIRGTTLTIAEAHHYVPMLTLEAINQAFGTYADRVANARKHICLSGCDGNSAIVGNLKDLAAALDRKVRFQIILIDADATYRSENMRKEYVAQQILKSRVEEATNILRTLNGEFPNRIALRILPIYPAGAFFIVDPPDGLFKFEMYLLCSEKHRQRPHIVIPKTARPLRKYFFEQWKLHWKLAERVPGLAPAWAEEFDPAAAKII